jgi:hypothetical protein
LITPPRIRRRRIAALIEMTTLGSWLRWMLGKALVWTMSVEVGRVFVKDRPSVTLVVDQHPVGALGADAADKPLRVAVRPRGPWWSPDHVDAFGGEHRVEGRGELGVPVANQETKRCDPVAEIHHQIAGLLGGPGRARVRGDAEDVHPAVGDLHHDQRVQPPQGDGVEVEEVDGQ